MSYLLGIDLGTSGVKSLLMSEEGRVLSVRSEEYPILTPREAWAEQDPLAWWRAAAGTIRACLAESAVRPKEIRCVGLSGQMHGMVLLDRRHEVIRPAIIWCDQRSVAEVAWIYETVGRERMNSITLNPLFPGFQLVSLAWVMRNEPESFRRVATVLLPKDYLRLRLTGGVCTEVTDASSTLAFDTAAERWSAEIPQALGLDPGIFPECRHPTDVVGAVSAEAAGETGLARGTPVIAGGSDQPMQAVGNGLTRSGVASSTIGTGGQIYAPCDAPVANPRMNTHTFCNVIPGMWYVMAATLSAGLSLSWFREKVLRDSDYATLAGEAGAVPAGSEGLLFLPYLGGERSPHMNPEARGMFLGLSLRHTRGHLTRAIMEGVVFSLRECLEQLGELGGAVERVIASGGGARSPLWLQLQADIFGRSIHTTDGIEHACRGAAIAAGVGIGLYPGFHEACSNLIHEREGGVEPVARHAAVYEEAYDRYRRAYQNTRELMGAAGEYSVERR